jgi:hypothetical protein
MSFTQIEEMSQKMAQMEQKMEKMEMTLSSSIKLNELFAKTLDVQGINIQHLSELCKKNQKESQQREEKEREEAKQREKEIEEEKRQEQYWHLYSKIENIALDVSTLYERLWLDVEKLIKKTDKNISDIADCNDRCYDLTQKFKRSDEKTNRVIDVTQYLLEQITPKKDAEYKTEVMKYGQDFP